MDEWLLEEARGLRSDVNDATLIDEALAALLAHHRVAEIDEAYRAYDDHPIDESDEWETSHRFVRQPVRRERSAFPRRSLVV